MNKETEFPQAELEFLADNLTQTFIQRWDLYPKQLEDGRFICIHKPLEQRHLIAHLQGKITLGAYVLDPESKARYVVIDADDGDQMDRLIQIARSLDCQGVPSYLETSRRGGHLWLFFEESVPGVDARTFGRGVLATHGLANIELFPKQDELQTGPGSLVRLPFGIHRMSGQRYGFITPDGEPLAASLVGQLHRLSTPQTVREAAFEAFWIAGQAAPSEPISEPSEAPTAPFSQRIKDSITVFDFVSQHIELTPRGRGHCPFHDDRHKSFSVNLEGNYWHCFAGCGGGSIIDFWMKKQDCDFTTAIHELVDMLL